MRTLSSVLLAVAACGAAGGSSGRVPATTDGPCTFKPRAGRAHGVWHDFNEQVDVPFDLPAVMCTTLVDRDGNVVPSGARLQSGTGRVHLPEVMARITRQTPT